MYKLTGSDNKGRDWTFPTDQYAHPGTQVMLTVTNFAGNQPRNSSIWIMVSSCLVMEN